MITRAHDGQIVGAFLQMWIAIGNFDPGLAALGEVEFATVDKRVHFREAQLQTFRRARRQRLPVKFRESRFRIERIDVARSALHEKKNHAFRLGGEMRRFGR